MKIICSPREQSLMIIFARFEPGQAWPGDHSADCRWRRRRSTATELTSAEPNDSNQAARVGGLIVEPASQPGCVAGRACCERVSQPTRQGRSQPRRRGAVGYHWRVGQRTKSSARAQFVIAPLARAACKWLAARQCKAAGARCSPRSQQQQLGRPNAFALRSG